MAEWEEFRISKANEAEDGVVKTGLVYDESKLNQSRLSVTWVSGNTWAPGSIYGSVQFEFDWRDLVKDKNIYWVEAIRTYRPPAFRFLISDEVISSELVHAYDPETNDGPLRLQGNEWSRNGALTSEFMFTESLSLRRQMTGLKFISHHANICSLGDINCEDKKRSATETGGQLLAWILANGIHKLDKFLRPSEELGPRSGPLEVAFSGLHSSLSTKGGFGGALSETSSCKAITLGALSLHGSNQADAAKALVSQKKTSQNFDSAITEIVREHFGTPKWQPDYF